MRHVLVLAAVAVLLTACAAQQVRRHEMALQLIVRAATGRVLTEKPAWVAPCFRLTRGALALVQSDELTTVAALEEYIVSEIDWGEITPEERDLLRFTIATIRQELENYLGAQNVLPQEAKLQVAAVLMWVNQTAALRLMEGRK